MGVTPREAFERGYKEILNERQDIQTKQLNILRKEEEELEENLAYVRSRIQNLKEKTGTWKESVKDHLEEYLDFLKVRFRHERRIDWARDPEVFIGYMEVKAAGDLIPWYQEKGIQVTYNQLAEMIGEGA